MDIVVEAGGSFTALTKSYYRTIADGFIDIAVEGKLSGIEIFALPSDFEIPPTPAPTSMVETIYRINVGSFAFTDPEGNVWSADELYTGGADFNAGNIEIAETTNDALYQTERWGAFSYALPVDAGETFEIILHFCELYHSSAGARVFDVFLEGEADPVLDDLDVVAVSGAKFVASQYTFTRTIADGFINMDFVPVQDNAKLNGIEVRRLP